MERLQREARALASLSHPNIVHIYSVEQAEGLHFFTMEVVQGEGLDKLLPSEGFPLERFFQLAVPLADALSAAHDRGVTHRDLKPSNLLVTEDERRIKIVDFGLAKLTPEQSGPLMSQLPTEAVTAEGRVLSTMPYMSPEQIEGKPIDHRTDIFSVGVVLYGMATGRHPFQGDSSPSLVSSILKDKPPSLIEVDRRLPRQLGRIIHRCLEKEPLNRFQSARDLYNELRDLGKEIETDELLRSSGSAMGSAQTGPRESFGQEGLEGDATWSRRGLSWKQALAAGLALFLLGAASVWLAGAGRTASPPAAVPPLRSEILLGGVAPLALVSGRAAIGYDAPMIAMSRDGRRLVYVSRTAGDTVLMLREMATAFPPDRALFRLAQVAIKTYRPRRVTANGKTYRPCVLPGVVTASDLFGVSKAKIADMRDKLDPDIMEEVAVGLVPTGVSDGRDQLDRYMDHAGETPRPPRDRLGNRSSMPYGFAGGRRMRSTKSFSKRSTSMSVCTVQVLPPNQGSIRSEVQTVLP